MSKNEDHWAIVIGIDAYPQLRPLSAARKDAARFAEWLERDDGGSLPGANIRLVLSPSEFPDDPINAEPVEKHVTRALKEVGVLTNERIGQRLYFYFAGHGVGPDFDDVGMLLADAEMKQLTNNIGLRLYRSFFHRFGLFDELVFILDCCRDPVRGIDTHGPRFNLVDPPQPPRVNDCVILGAPWGEKAFEPADATSGERRGLLTTALLEALNGAPEAIDPLGRVTSFSLRNYIKNRVQKMAVEKKLKQELQVLTDEEIILATIAREEVPKVHLQIVAPVGLAGTLILRAWDGRELDQRPTAQACNTDAVWLIDLARNTNYQIEHLETKYAIVYDPRANRGDSFVFKFPMPPP
jgi:hypothetical protein